MKINLVSIKKNEGSDDTYDATLEVQDDKDQGPTHLKRSLERSLKTSVAVESMRAKLDEVAVRAQLLYTTSIEREREHQILTK